MLVFHLMYSIIVKTLWKCVKQFVDLIAVTIYNRTTFKTIVIVKGTVSSTPSLLVIIRVDYGFGQHHDATNISASDT